MARVEQAQGLTWVDVVSRWASRRGYPAVLINACEPGQRQAQEEPSVPAPPCTQPWWVSTSVGSGFQLCSPISLAATSPCPSCPGPQNCGIGKFQVTHLG